MSQVHFPLKLEYCSNLIGYINLIIITDLSVYYNINVLICYYNYIALIIYTHL